MSAKFPRGGGGGGGSRTFFSSKSKSKSLLFALWHEHVFDGDANELLLFKV